MIRRLFPILVFIMSIIFAGCSEDDNIVNQEEHFEAVGLIIKQSGVTVLDYFGPDYQSGDTSAYLDTLKLSLGLNPHWNVFFYNEDGEEIDPPLTPDEGGDKTFAGTFTPTTMAELWWHEGEDGYFEFHVRGLESGHGKVVFNVMHVGHADFTTLPIPILVDTNVLHDAPLGVKLLDEESGTILATAWISDSSHSEGALYVGADDSTDHIEAIFFDANGTEFWPDVPPHSLVITSSDSSVISIGGQEEDEPWAFKLYGHNNGSATITVYIYHDENVGKTFSAVNAYAQ